MKKLWRYLVYGVVILLAVGGSGAIGFTLTMQEAMSVYDKPAPVLSGKFMPAFDPQKPTAAVLLANEVTEVFDFLVPYEMFAMTEAYNVFAAAPDLSVKSLTGGLDVVPHYTFDELDRLMGGGSPDVIVIPYMPILNEGKYRPVREWIRKHSGPNTTLLSICNGAENLADTGLLNGKSAATHWGDVGRLARTYKEVQWKKDRRYVPDGNLVSSAGLTSGIDATLYVIAGRLGEPAAAKVAKELNYPSYHYVGHPQMEPYSAGPRDLVYVLNQAFQWNKKKDGILLYPGADELALSSAFDTYGASGTTTTLTVSGRPGPVVSRHGLNLLARYTAEDAPKLDRMLLVGADVKERAADDIRHWSGTGSSAQTLFLHSGAPERFAMDPALEDLARQEDVQTARFAAKRLEYRATDGLKLEGAPFPYEAAAVPAGIGLLSVAAASAVRRYFSRKRSVSR